MRFSTRWFGLLVACLTAVCVCRPAVASASELPVRTALSVPGFSATQPLAYAGAARVDATAHNTARRAVVDPRSALVNDATPQASSTAGGFAGINAVVAPTASLTVTKTGPAVLAVPAMPLAHITEPATDTFTITVDDVSQLTFGQYVQINGNYPQVVNIIGNDVVLDSTVTVAVGDEVLGSFVYVITYRNDGSTPATGLLLTDTLPYQTKFHHGHPWRCVRQQLPSQCDLESG